MAAYALSDSLSGGLCVAILVAPLEAAGGALTGDHSGISGSAFYMLS